MKKSEIICTILVLALLLCCSIAAAETFTDPTLGISFELPEGVTADVEEMNDVIGVGDAIFSTAEAEIVQLVVATEKGFAEYIGNLDDYRGSENVIVDMRNGYIYLLIYDPEPDAWENVQAVLAGYAEATYVEPQPVSYFGTEKVTFHTINANGDPVDESIFEGKDLTMVNVWATWCNPCLNEMPELAQIMAQLPENKQIVLLCDNVTSLDDAQGMKIINAVADKAGIPRENILLSDPNGSTDVFSEYSDAVPTSFFINGAGVRTSDMVVGAYPATYREILGVAQ